MSQATIGPDHPALAGHFPGHPVVPAVVILSEVLAAARRAHPGIGVGGIRKAKFLHRLEPGRPFDIELGTPSGDTLKFTCRSGATVLVQGRLALRRVEQREHGSARA